ncbi:tRNAHis guanylyltransferase [compost metagenome]
MSVKKYDELSKRMKSYESSSKVRLTPRMPIIIRIDGCHFHTYTKGFEKPFDEMLVRVFWETCKYLAENIMGCKMVYHQSDEISLLITNYDKLTTQSWFDNELQKMVSVSASLATAKFNEEMRKINPNINRLATFDSRAFIMPLSEVTNYFVWRQQDASKNSVSMLAQSLFPHNELQGLSGKVMQDKMFTEKNVNWNDLSTWKKRGATIIKEKYNIGEVQRTRWIVDEDMPIITQDRDYVDNLFMPEAIVENLSES